MTLGEQIRAYRLDRDLTWEALAARAGVSASCLWKIANDGLKGGQARELTEHRIRQRLGLAREEPGRITHICLEHGCLEHECPDTQEHAG